MSETVTARISKWASELSYDDLTDDAIREAKRYMLDSFGCALGGSPVCPLGATTSAVTLSTVLDKMGNLSFGGPPVVVTSGASGSFIIVDEAVIPGPTP